jgi:arginine repressor
VARHTIRTMETISRFYHVDRDSIHYIRWIIESYDGMAVVTTIDPEKGIIELRISPGCESIVDELIDSLKKDESIKLNQIN